MDTYEKKYKEALERATKAKNNASISNGTLRVLGIIFPELAESEDERIRKWIIGVLSAYEHDRDLRNAAIAWLEKQGEPMEINPTEFDTRLQALIGKFDNLPKEELIGSLSFWMNVVQNDGTYRPDKKQSEQKPVVIIPKFRIGDNIKTTNKEPLTITKIDGKGYWSEDLLVCDFDDAAKWELVEQKPANEVEPKFKVGDFIVNDYCMGKVIELTNDAYLLDNGQGIPFSCEHNAHLWTIADAKDGDILCTYECDEPKIVFIIKGTPKKHYALSYYCYYNIMYPHFASDSEKGCLAPNDEDVKPANKEQRDFLFEKMKKAGYEWDVEKKELKKIIVPIFNIGDTIIKKHNSDIHNFGSFTITDITGSKYWYNDRVICEISEQDEWELYEPVRQKSAWSEEDDAYKLFAISAVEDYYDEENPLRKDLIDWLNSLKQRIGG